MKIRAVELNNFRKFRAPRRVEGFADGLNIVVEANETGKSTLLEALRAALFIRHSANTELTRSYCPIGDQVAPRVSLAFEMADGAWQLDKQFLRSTSAHLSGPSGRFENDAAEEQLQKMFGFDRGNNKGTDPDTRGALGLLWVEQATALNIEAPGARVRETVRSALEGEVGAILGGHRFEAVRSAVEAAYGTLRTGKAGSSTGLLRAAEERLRALVAEREAAEGQARAYEASLAELEQARSRKRLLERELVDPEQAALRTRLEQDLRHAQAAQTNLAAARARDGEARSVRDRLADLLGRIDAAAVAVSTASAAIEVLASASGEADQAHQDVVDAEAECRERLAEARTWRTTCDRAAMAARAAAAANQRQAAISAARARLQELDSLARELAEQDEQAAAIVDGAVLAELEALERAAIEARAVAAAGAVMLKLDRLDTTPVAFNDEAAADGIHQIDRLTKIRVGDHAVLTITPPGQGMDSAMAGRLSAEQALEAAYERTGFASAAAATKQNEQARSASERASALRRQIATLCVADPSLDLVAGPAALRQLLNELPDTPPTAESAPLDLGAAEEALRSAVEAEQEALGRHEAMTAALKASEEERVERQRARALAERDLETAERHYAELIKEQARDAVANSLQTAREEAQRLAAALTEAEQAASTFDAEALSNRLENMTRAETRARDERDNLIARVASLEATVLTEGPKGAIGAVAQLRDEEIAAAGHVARLVEEAEILALLRGTLRAAADDAERTFLGPVTRRAARYVSSVLPGSDLVFDQSLGLAKISRGGQEEASDCLSRGTQEQLAVLTRLAFADLLLEQGAPVSLILDDPLVYSDDARLDVMTNILTEASKRMQVILLTCRERAFRHIDATRINL